MSKVGGGVEQVFHFRNIYSLPLSSISQTFVLRTPQLAPPLHPSRRGRLASYLIHEHEEH